MGKAFKLFILLLVIFLFAFFFITFFYINSKLSEKISLKEEKEVYIKKGSSLKEIAGILEEKDIIPDKHFFYYYSRFKGKPLKSGFYVFKGNYTIPEIWEILVKGKEHLIRFTIIPGDNLFDISKKVRKTFNIEEHRFLSFVFDKENLKRYNLTGYSFEGYLPPETYTLRKNISLRELIDILISHFKKNYMPLLKQSKEFSPYQLMIISSMVEKETALKSEKPVIAGVIINRLKRGMLLQIDPTTIYALKLAGKWKGKLTKKNIHFNSPFNTYVYKGLPPSPICSFSLDTLKSTLNYKKTEFLYYLSKDGKKHIFSRTYREHIKALKGYKK
jgi:UPF0755 protein